MRKPKKKSTTCETKPLKDASKMSNEEIHKDVAAAINACWKIICDMVMQYEERYRWKLAARVGSSVWAVINKPVLTQTLNHLATGDKLP